MKNIPKKIYLQIGDELTDKEISELDFNDLSGISWCSERIHKTDIEFILPNNDIQNSKFVCDVCEKNKNIERYEVCHECFCNMNQ